MTIITFCVCARDAFQMLKKKNLRSGICIGRDGLDWIYFVCYALAGLIRDHRATFHHTQAIAMDVWGGRLAGAMFREWRWLCIRCASFHLPRNTQHPRKGNRPTTEKLPMHICRMFSKYEQCLSSILCAWIFIWRRSRTLNMVIEFQQIGSHNTGVIVIQHRSIFFHFHTRIFSNPEQLYCFFCVLGRFPNTHRCQPIVAERVDWMSRTCNYAYTATAICAEMKRTSHLWCDYSFIHSVYAT